MASENYMKFRIVIYKDLLSTSHALMYNFGCSQFGSYDRDLPWPFRKSLFGTLLKMFADCCSRIWRKIL